MMRFTKHPVNPVREAAPMSRLDLYCSVDTCWQAFAPWWEREQLASARRQRQRATRLSPGEIMTILILILFQQSG